MKKILDKWRTDFTVIEKLYFGTIFLAIFLELLFAIFFPTRHRLFDGVPGALFESFLFFMFHLYYKSKRVNNALHERPKRVKLPLPAFVTMSNIYLFCCVCLGIRNLVLCALIIGGIIKGLIQ